MKIIWADSDPSMNIPDREELEAELAKDQESSPSGTSQDAVMAAGAQPVLSFIGFKGFGR